MSAGGAVLTSVDLESGRAVLETQISLDKLFDEAGEWRVIEDEHGWAGFVRESGDDGPEYYFVDTTREDWLRKLRVGKKAIFQTLQRRAVEVDLLEELRRRSR